ncbi:MAG: hypothetical protein PHW40_07305 [Candidatus Izemoplasmatales bacterium]|nr:hypothetical protein [Candidatus Izemoplasmatales bacterium]
MNDQEQMETTQKEIFDFIQRKANRQISYREAQSKFPGCDHVLAMMLIDEILEIKEVDGELVYIISVDNLSDVS